MTDHNSVEEPWSPFWVEYNFAGIPMIVIITNKKDWELMIKDSGLTRAQILRARLIGKKNKYPTFKVAQKTLKNWADERSGVDL